MSTPEVRLSPDGKQAALFRQDLGAWVTTSMWLVQGDAEVSEWTPLLPVSNEDGAS